MGITAWKVASEFVLGELGWSTFEAREAQSKIRYFARISAMDSSRWPRKILSMMATVGIYTEAIRKLENLKRRYACSDIPLEYWEDLRANIMLFNSDVNKRIREKQNELWKEAVGSKSSLSVYRQHKERGVTAQGLYQNDRGSALLALARAGMLPTRAHRAKFQQIDAHCTKCGRDIETIAHVIMNCEPQPETEELARRLGFNGQEDEATWTETRKRLETWEAQTRKIR